MPRLVCLLLGAVALLCLGRDGAWIGHAAAQAEAPARPGPMEETPEALPEGEGREETFYRCTACHGTAVIRRSRLSRERWDELMDWMTERQGMPPLEGEERRLIVDYLAGAFPPQQQRRRGGANPFLPD